MPGLHLAEADPTPVSSFMTWLDELPELTTIRGRRA